MRNDNNWKTKTMLIGAVVGAITGIAAAMIVIERAERERTTPSISAGDGVKLGLGVLGLMRLISDLGDRK
jgi:hypothetical protein